MIHKIKVPRLGVNEDLVTIVEWLAKDKERINVDQPICSVETSKASFEISAEHNGFLRIRIRERNEVKIQEVIGYIVDSKDAVIPEEPKPVPEPETKALKNKTTISKVVATKKAIEFAQKLGIDLNKVPAKGLIRKSDIEKFAEKNTKPDSAHVKSNIAIYGAGAGGSVARECAELTNKYKVKYFIDDNPDLVDKFVDGLKVLSGRDLKSLVSLGVKNVFVAISDSKYRLKLREKLEALGLEIVNLIHPHSYIAPSSIIGHGNFIKAGAVIDSNTKIGNFCIVDNGVFVAHDSSIGDGSHLAPGVVLGSSIIIGKNTLVGIGSSICTKVKIGDNVIISVGSSVVKDIPDNCIVEGVPGKIIGNRINSKK